MNLPARAPKAPQEGASTSSTQQAFIPPQSYTIVSRKQTCFCGASHQYTELYYRRAAKSHYTGKTTTQLTRIDGNRISIEYSLPIEHISMTEERLPFCSECYLTTPALKHLPLPPLPKPKAILSVATDPREAPQSSLKPTSAQSAAREPTARKPTADSIFSDLGL
jgi:hypothetical protein